MHIVIVTIPHHTQKYPTVGDYYEDKDGIGRTIYVSEMGNRDYEFLVAVHEMLEQHLILKRGIKNEDIVAFDKQYEAEREQGLHSPDDEPGFHAKAPYRKEHVFATAIEMLVAKEMGVDWDAYGDVVNSL